MEDESPVPVIEQNDVVWSHGDKAIRIKHAERPYSACAHAGYVLIIERGQPLEKNLSVYRRNGDLVESPRLPGDRAIAFYQFDYARGRLRVNEDGAVAVVVLTLGGDLVYWLQPETWTLTYGHSWR